MNSRNADVSENLAAHVSFLAQPALEGRQPKTAGSRLARRYIEEHFQACGLVPWGKERGYELPYGLGKNVVGVIPGTDTNCAGEIVLVSAHYDHLGKDAKGTIHPGAGDNASGVATLLEVARQLSDSNQHPKRTVAFAAFDGEEQMLVGSFAFTCRKDVEKTKIVAVVNIDMLGRDLVDVVTNTVLVGGTGNRPALQAQLCQFGDAAGLRVLPVASDGVGPRSDHAAFDNQVGLCLFFTCGPFKDYHKPSDTAEKINYTTLTRSAQLVFNTVTTLANEDHIPSATPGRLDRQELKSLQTITSELYDSTAIKPQDRPAVLHLRQSIDAALENRSDDPDASEKIYLEVTTALMPCMMGQNTSPRSAALNAIFEHVYLNHHREMLDAQKQIIGEMIKHPHGFLRSPPPLGGSVYEISALSFRENATNGYALHGYTDNFDWAVQSKKIFGPLKAPKPFHDSGIEPFDCEGSRGDLVDYCLLNFYRRHTNQFYAQTINKVMRTVLGTAPEGSYTNWLQNRLRQVGCVDETEWILRCMRSTNLQVVRKSISAAHASRDPRIENAACELILDRKTRPDIRRDAMYLAMRHPDTTNLLAMTEVIDDHNQFFKREDAPEFKPDYPLTNSTGFLAMRPIWEWQLSNFDKTLGQEALDLLKRVTKKDFGTDAQAWRKWILSLTPSQMKAIARERLIL